MLIVCSFEAQLDACKAISELGRQEANFASVDDEHSSFDNENSTLSDKGSRECLATVLQMEMEEISEDNERTSFPIENFGALMDAFWHRIQSLQECASREEPDQSGCKANASGRQAWQSEDLRNGKCFA
jgi:hypothetical protein